MQEEEIHKHIDKLLKFYLEAYPKKLKLTPKSEFEAFYNIFAKMVLQNTLAGLSLFEPHFEQQSYVLTRNSFEVITDLYLIDKANRKKALNIYKQYGSPSYTNKDNKEERKSLLAEAFPDYKGRVNLNYWSGMNLHSKCQYLEWGKLYDYFFEIPSQFTHSESYTVKSYRHFDTTKGVVHYFDQGIESEDNQMKYAIYLVCIFDMLNHMYAIFKFGSEEFDYGKKKLSNYLATFPEEVIVKKTIDQYFN